MGVAIKIPILRDSIFVKIHPELPIFYIILKPIRNIRFIDLVNIEFPVSNMGVDKIF